MNGGLSECIKCDYDPCICKEVARNEQIEDGRIVTESLWQAMAHLSRWRMKIVKWVWPDITRVAEDLKKYYWRESK